MRVFFLGQGSEHRRKVVSNDRDAAASAYRKATGREPFGYEFHKDVTAADVWQLELSDGVLLAADLTLEQVTAIDGDET